MTHTAENVYAGQGEELVDWRILGACGDEDPDLFFPVGNRGPALIQIAEAKAVCARCPVLAQCRRDALAAHEPFGIWGGLTEEERDALLAPTQSASPDQFTVAA